MEWRARWREPGWRSGFLPSIGQLPDGSAPARAATTGARDGRDERGRVRVVLTDDGVGRKGTSGAGGSGVDLIASLAAQVRARVDWDGGQGTRLTILLPMSIPSALGRRV
jgi:hypothetical protein